MLGAGAGMVLLFGSGLALMYAGAHIADLWM